MVGIGSPLQQVRVDQPAVEPHPDPHAGLGVIGLLLRHQIVEFAVQVRNREQGKHPRDGLMLGGAAGDGHCAGLADLSDARPKNMPAVISSSDVAYAHQMGTASSWSPRTNWLMPIMESDTAKHTAPAAVHGVGNRASSAGAHHGSEHRDVGRPPERPSPVRRVGARTSVSSARQASTVSATAISARRRPARQGQQRGQGSTGARSGTRPVPTRRTAATTDGQQEVAECREHQRTHQPAAFPHDRMSPGRTPPAAGQAAP